jgi:hypothetical protein
LRQKWTGRMSKPAGVRPAPPPQNRWISSTSRRTFFRRALGGLAIALPAYGVLASAIPAQSAVSPHACSANCPAPCSKVYLQYEGHHCASGGAPGSCAGPVLSSCIGTYDKFDVHTGQYCGSFTDNEGACS